jgi:cytochrome c553
MMKKIIILIVIGLTFTSCKKNESVYEAVSKTEVEVNVERPHPGKALLETQCYLCHSPSAPEKEGRVGPPMIAIKAHYIKDETTKEEFTKELWNFIEKPTEDKAKLKGAVRRFGLMPYQPFKKDDIEKIAEYLYEYEIEEPEWFGEHFENNHGKKGKGHKGKGRNGKGYKNQGKKSGGNHAKSPEEVGLKYALETKKVLGKNLMGTIQKSGTVEALQFCNEKAYPLTDSMANNFNAQIKRVSDKPRNPSNQADLKELEKIEYFKNAVANNEDIQPIVERFQGEKHFYYPILTNSMCLQCHGKPSVVKSDVMASIKKLYPNDMAIGYDVNQVRGIWSISFKNHRNE